MSRPLGRFSHRVAMSVCLFLFVCHRETPTCGGRKNFWSKGVLLILVCDDTILRFCFNGFLGFLIFLSFRNHPTVEHPSVRQPTVDNEGVSDPTPTPPLLPPSLPFFFHSSFYVGNVARIVYEALR